MKKLFTLALAIILTLTALCGVSLLADDIGTQAIIDPPCEHKYWVAEVAPGRFEETVSCCETRIHTYDIYRCSNCGKMRIENEVINTVLSHNYDNRGPDQREDGHVYVHYVCTKCGDEKYVLYSR